MNGRACGGRAQGKSLQQPSYPRLGDDSLLGRSLGGALDGPGHVRNRSKFRPSNSVFGDPNGQSDHVGPLVKLLSYKCSAQSRDTSSLGPQVSGTPGRPGRGVESRRSRPWAENSRLAGRFIINM